MLGIENIKFVTSFLILFVGGENIAMRIFCQKYFESLTK
jgi:hypothetical protein